MLTHLGPAIYAQLLKKFDDNSLAIDTLYILKEVSKPIAEDMLQKWDHIHNKMKSVDKKDISQTDYNNWYPCRMVWFFWIIKRVSANYFTIFC